MREKLKPILKTLISIGVLVYLFNLIIFYWSLTLDDGPFHGTARVDCPQRKPDQIFETLHIGSLLVFDPTNDEKYPTVALRGRDDTVQWCIFVDAREDSIVEKVRFQGLKHIVPGMNPYLIGTVDWTYGSEKATWSFDSKGVLQWYKFAW